jgi:hypothetical protein
VKVPSVPVFPVQLKRRAVLLSANCPRRRRCRCGGFLLEGSREDYGFACAQEFNWHNSRNISFASASHDRDLAGVECLIDEVRKSLSRFANRHTFHSSDHCTAGTNNAIRTNKANCTIRTTNDIMSLVEFADRELGLK